MLLILASLICVPAQAADLEIDQANAYSLAAVAAARIGTGDIFGTYFQYDGSVLKSINGIDVSTMDFAAFGRQYQRTLENIQAELSASGSDIGPKLDALISSFNNFSSNFSYALLPLIKSLASDSGFYLPRLDAAVDEVEGKLNNLYDSLSVVQSKQDAALENFNAKFGTVFSYWDVGSNGAALRVNKSFAEYLTAASGYQVFNSIASSGLSYLSKNGRVSKLGTTAYYAPLYIEGLLGLSDNLVGDDKYAGFSFLAVDEENGGLTPVLSSADNLLDALGLIGTQLQNPLAKLQYVLADDDDIVLKDATKENQDSFTDNFTGEGEGAVSGSQIKDIAGIGTSIKDTFAGAGSPADIFSVLNDSGNYGFFSQAVADELDRVANPAVAAADDDVEDWLKGCEVGEDGVVRVVDDKWFDLSSYLEGLNK